MLFTKTVTEMVTEHETDNSFFFFKLIHIFPNGNEFKLKLIQADELHPTMPFFQVGALC